MLRNCPDVQRRKDDPDEAWGCVVLLAVLLLAAVVSAGYMVMCAYIATVTGSTAGLADIGNAAAFSAGFSALAVVIRLGRWWR
ncbi:hypothetical protein [Mycolicibacterium mageritense]|uniref:hypothetical protein n=1 Tax=Mycolicibacterium mageritense TaxID=53462 RepID=UPI001E5153E7|nr:hypothetical protein [Mycolicibacterium mageritense]